MPVERQEKVNFAKAQMPAEVLGRDRDDRVRDVVNRQGVVTSSIRVSVCRPTGGAMKMRDP